MKSNICVHNMLYFNLITGCIREVCGIMLLYYSPLTQETDKTPEIVLY